MPFSGDTSVRRLPLQAFSARRDLAYRDPLSLWAGAPLLRRSLAEQGLLHPVTVCQPSPDDFSELHLVAGFRRVAALQELGQTEVLARTVGAPLAECFFQAVEEHAGQEHNVRERARALQVARRLGCDVATMARRLNPALGLEPSVYLVEQYLKLLHLPSTLLDLFVSKGFSLRRCLPYCQLPSEHAELLARVGTELRLGARQLEELSTWLQEIAARDAIPLQQVVEELELLPAAGPPKEPKDKKAHLSTAWQRVERRRFPQTSRRRDAIGALVQELRQLGLTVRFDSNFTSDAIALALEIQRPEQLDEVAQALVRPQTRQAVSRILKKL